MTDFSEFKLVWQALAQAAAQPEKPGYIYLGREITFKEMDEASDRVAMGLLNSGIQKGDRIGIIGLNQPEWLEMYFAAAKIGAVIVGLSVRFRDMELDYIINHSGAKALLTLAKVGEMDYSAFFTDFKNKIPSVEHYIFMGGEGFGGSSNFEELRETEVDHAVLDAAKNAIQPDDLLILIYTSGTTGRPKGAAISHKSQLASAGAQAAHTKVCPEDVVPVALPFNHVGGITCAILTNLLGRSLSILIPMFSPDEVIKQLKIHGGTVMPGVPTMHLLVLKSEIFSEMDADKFRLVITGGSNADPTLLKMMSAQYPNASVMNLYGLSESSGTLVMSPWESDFDTTLRSIGKPVGDFRVKVMDEEGREAPTGETGELRFKGGAVVQGYFNMPDETAEGFTDGWLHTGDMGYLDENGYINLMGRKKEMFLQGGFNVYPVEVENLLTKHPKVLMAAGIGVPDPVLGEVGRYYIVPQPGAEPPAEEEIKDYCRRHLADYKVPRQIVFRNELPLTPVGKIMKSTLKEQYEQKGE